MQWSTRAKRRMEEPDPTKKHKVTEVALCFFVGEAPYSNFINEYTNRYLTMTSI